MATPTFVASDSDVGSSTATVLAPAGLAEGDIVMVLGCIQVDALEADTINADFDMTDFSEPTGGRQATRFSSLGGFKRAWHCQVKIMTVGPIGDHPTEYSISVTFDDGTARAVIGWMHFTGTPDDEWAYVLAGSHSDNNTVICPGIPISNDDELSIRGFGGSFTGSPNTPSGFEAAIVESTTADIKIRSAYAPHALSPSGDNWNEDDVTWGTGGVTNSLPFTIRVFDSPEPPGPTPPGPVAAARAAARIHYPDWAFAPNPAQLDQNYKTLMRFCRTSAESKCALRLRFKPTAQEQTWNWHQIERWAYGYVSEPDCHCQSAADPVTAIQCYLRVPHKEWATTTRDPVHERENWLAVDRWMGALTTDGECQCIEDTPEG